MKKERDDVKLDDTKLANTDQERDTKRRLEGDLEGELKDDVDDMVADVTTPDRKFEVTLGPKR